MKKITAIILLMFMLLTLSGCFGYHRITISEGDEDLVKCKSFARTGDVVEFETVTVTDADLYVNVSDVEVECVREGLYRFVMPDQDVEINITIVSNGLA